jgi:hypothetical protein
LIITCGHHQAIIFIAPQLGMEPSSHSYTLSTRISPLVSSITLNQTRTFNLPLFGNWWQPIYKDFMIKFFWIHVACPSFLPCVKWYGQVSWTRICSNCSPYIYAKKFGFESSHICLDRKYRSQFLPNDAKV